MVRENAAGGVDLAATAVGQQEQLTLSSPSSTAMSRVEVMPQLIGPATATLAGGLQPVLDQPVRMEPSTALVDHASATAIALNLEVEPAGPALVPARQT